MLGYELSPYAKNTACPTFISQAEGDPIAANAPKLYEAITAPRVLEAFARAEGAGITRYQGVAARVAALAKSALEHRWPPPGYDVSPWDRAEKGFRVLGRKRFIAYFCSIWRTHGFAG